MCCHRGLCGAEQCGVENRGRTSDLTVIKLERLKEGEMYRIQNLNPSVVDDDDDTTLIVQLETSGAD